MKDLGLSFILFLASINLAYSQNNSFPLSGNVGIGTSNPSSKLHIIEDSHNELNGTDDPIPTSNLELQGMSSGRIPGQGPSLIFSFPANSDGSNIWAQARILATPDNVHSWNAMGRLYLQVRDAYNPGTGGSWNWRTGIMITGNGNVGIATTSPSERLHVDGNSIITGAIKAGTNSGTITQTASYPYSTTIETGADAGQLLFNAGSTTGYVSKISISGRTNGGGIQFHTRSNEIMRISDEGNVLIGKIISNLGTNYKLDVSGTIRANEIVVNTDGADFVFEPTYKLRNLSELEAYIKANKHLPDIAPAKEMQENGVSAGEMQTKLLQKIEELTLYMIALKKENEQLKTNSEKQRTSQEELIDKQNQTIAAQQQILLEMKKEIESLKSHIK